MPYVPQICVPRSDLAAIDFDALTEQVRSRHPLLHSGYFYEPGWVLAPRDRPRSIGDDTVSDMRFISWAPRGRIAPVAFECLSLFNGEPLPPEIIDALQQGLRAQGARVYSAPAAEQLIATLQSRIAATTPSKRGEIRARIREGQF